MRGKAEEITGAPIAEIPFYGLQFTLQCCIVIAGLVARPVMFEQLHNCRKENNANVLRTLQFHARGDVH